MITYTSVLAYFKKNFKATLPANFSDGMLGSEYTLVEISSKILYYYQL